MNRARPMPSYYARRVIIAEMVRAEMVGRDIDREYLRSETGLHWDALERRIRVARMERLSAANLSAAEGGAKDKDGQSPTVAVRSRLLCAPYPWADV
jgi:hypothetical protein